MLATVCREASHLDTMLNWVKNKREEPDGDENEEVGSDPGKTDPNQQKPGNMLHPKAQTWSELSWFCQTGLDRD